MLSTGNDPKPRSTIGSAAPRVSVVMPVRNTERYIDEAIRSVRSQTMHDLELLVVLNGSTDASEEIANRHANEDTRIRILKCPETGTSFAMNWGVKHARADWIARLDGDDIWLRQKLEKQLQLVTAHPDLGAVATFGEIVSESGKVVAQFSAGGPINRREFSEMRDDSLISLLSSSVMFSKNASNEVGGHRVDLVTAQDVDFWNRIADKHTILSVPEVAVHYRMHTGSASFRKFFTQATTARMVAWNMRLRRSGKAELDFEEYRKVESRWSKRRKLKIALRDRSRYCYRHGGVLLANNHWQGAFWLIASVLLYPAAPIKKGFHQNLHGGLSRLFRFCL